MSYSRNYSASVHYEGSVRYNYPASQNGGSDTAHFSGSVPINVTIYVDTQPFDGSIENFNRSVNALTGSVVAMNTAQCAVIQQTANEVSETIINGFFGTIKTELSQQIQALDSAIKATFGLLVQQDKAVTDKKIVMEGDYNRISSRYIRLFTDLDNECHKRIYALDNKSFILSEKVLKELLTESSSNTAALNLLSIEEITSSKTLMFISSLNRKAHEVLQTLHEYITQESKMNALINSLLSNDEINGNISFFIPVIWVESDMLEGNKTQHESFIPDYISQQENAFIVKKTDGFCSSISPSEWKDIPETEKEMLNKEFKILAENNFVDLDDKIEQRVYKTMLSLWQNANIVSL